VLGRFDCYPWINILKILSLALTQKRKELYEIRIQGLCSKDEFGNMSFFMCMKDPGKKGIFYMCSCDVYV